ncbi:MAG: Cytidylate kinase [Candidatus Moranbacteria bacterium GW2011_GWE1_35_17]|nr:MAG: Cytidylate kinase [Candidatus Moranbacteria bacterium GW2011_GWE1_35_17]KKP72268.1 MAG: Cytidylate kinase [Candidatus Moranbacteria bacterium GW2011_GWE2_35_164]KKP84273.1 MAG: Cytidylate kinase [Candidatus Moranbacteria bacterium GW2011_GWF2_35_54]
MIISFNGDHGSGKSTVAKKVAEKLNYPRYYMGQIFRKLAEEKGMLLSDFQSLCDNDPSADKKVDEYSIELAKKEKDFVIESRTYWYFVPDSIKIYLKVDEREAAKRILKEIDANAARKAEDKNLDSLESIIISERDRTARDDKRYMQYYGINIRDEKNYDFVLDTSNLSKEEVFDKVMDFINSKNNV